MKVYNYVLAKMEMKNKQVKQDHVVKEEVGNSKQVSNSEEKLFVSNSRSIQLQQVQKLYYLSLLEEKKLILKKERFKFVFAVILMMLFFVPGSLLKIKTMYKELNLMRRVKNTKKSRMQRFYI